MNLFTINVKSNPLMRQSRVESDIEHGVHLGGVGFWQEIAPKRYKAALARRAQAANAAVLGISTESPVTLNRAVWEVESVQTHFMHHGIAHITPTRWVVEVRAHHRHDHTQRVTFFSTHFISGAWSNRRPLTRARRRRLWFLHFGKLQSLVDRALHDGYSVVMGMDANRSITALNFHRDQVILSAHGIDGIIAIPATGLAVVKGTEDVIKGLFTDHDPVTVSAHFKAANPPQVA